MAFNRFSKRFLFMLVLVIAGLVFIQIQRSGNTKAPLLVSWFGETMGTTYEVKLAGVILDDERLDELSRALEAELVAVNQAMSTYIPESEISQFNRRDTQDQAFSISERFQRVMMASLRIHDMTGGAFDPTLGPLIDLWGFGAGKAAESAPTDAEVQAKLEHVGLSKIEVEEGTLSKRDSRMEVNLSAIAKGYAVDRLVDLLQGAGFDRVYVEIGGEVACRGLNPSGLPWRIGIQLPERDASASYIRVVRLHNRALATSGDYRNFMEDPDRNRHHIIDPRTGMPAEHRLASVSVLAEDCMTADAIATALYVMGTEEGMAWLEKEEGLEALFIDRQDGGFHFTATEGFEDALIAVP